MPPIGRRTVLKLAAGGAALAALPVLSSRALGATAPADIPMTARDGLLSLQFDHAMRTRLSYGKEMLTPFQASEALLLKGGGAIEAFAFKGEETQAVNDPRHGTGRRQVFSGVSAQGIEKQVAVTFFDASPGLAVVQVRYRNVGQAAVEIAGWRALGHELGEKPGGFWSYSGTTHEDRRDWVQRLDEGFDQRNTLGMDAEDYGGGTPVANIWRRDIGLAVGHVEPLPHSLDLPVRRTAKGASIAVEQPMELVFAPGQELTTQRLFLSVHTGDHFAPLVLYRGFMAAEGISAPEAPSSAFEPTWCAWGYERDFTVAQILATLPKVREVGFKWAVLDDGWQTNEGDWRIDRRKFPRGDADMRAFVAQVRAQGLRPRLWLAPLAADPGSDVLHEHSDMLLLDKYGAFQKVSWWNALTQCPAYQPTIDYYVALVKKAIGNWRFEGIKLDGQHLNAVAPCYNPAHHHASPTDSCQGLPEFWNAIHRAAHEANPEAVVELCPCGTAFAFHNLPATDQFPASDPLSSWQVRSKGKSIKALMGSGSSYAGDHVELSDGRDDFASSVGIGAVISSKFTWPRDTDTPIEPLPAGGYVLTAEKEALWKKWVALYQEHMLPKGEYRGELYDIGFDAPEAHAIAKDGAMYYAFYAPRWSGQLELRGLGSGRYRVRDMFNGNDMGTVDAASNRLAAGFEGFLLLQAVPEATA